MQKDGLLHIKFHIFLFLLEPKMWVLLWAVLMSQFKQIQTTRGEHMYLTKIILVYHQFLKAANKFQLIFLFYITPLYTYCSTVIVPYWKLIKSKCTLANSEDQDECHVWQHFIMVGTICLEKDYFQTGMHHDFETELHAISKLWCISVSQIVSVLNISKLYCIKHERIQKYIKGLMHCGTH